jgi:chromate reductase
MSPRRRSTRDDVRPALVSERPGVRVLGIAGSLRRASYNRALLQAACDLAPAAVEIVTFPLDRIPAYNGDVEAVGDPPPVVDLKQAIRGSDALLISTPEYNFGVPGVLKNALDWASRPPFRSPLANKPVGLMGASTGHGGTRRAQEQLRQALRYPNASVLEEPEVFVGEAYSKFGPDRRLADAGIRDRLREFLAALHAHCVATMSEADRSRAA